MVTVEKFQGPCGYSPSASPACRQEDLIVAELKKVKELNPNVSTVFYYNSVLDFPQCVPSPARALLAVISQTQPALFFSSLRSLNCIIPKPNSKKKKRY